MSTISKLNPEVRHVRTARRNSMRSLARALPYIPSMERRLAAAVLLDVMHAVSRDSRRTGHAKSRIFADLMVQLMPAQVAA